MFVIDRVLEAKSGGVIPPGSIADIVVCPRAIYRLDRLEVEDGDHFAVAVKVEAATWTPKNRAVSKVIQEEMVGTAYRQRDRFKTIGVGERFVFTARNVSENPRRFLARLVGKTVVDL